MTQAGQRTAVVPLPFDKGMWTSGDPSLMPDGYCLALRNYLMRPLRADCRPPFVYDGLMSVANFLRWEDLTSQVTRTLAIDASQNLRTKNTSGTGYTATVVTGSPTGRLTDFANFMGKVYQLFDDGAGVPAGASVYDGNAVSASPFNTTFYARTVTAFIERLFFAYPRIAVTNSLGTTKAYVASGGSWTLANVETDNIVTGSATTGRLTPTNNTTAYAYTTEETVTALAVPAKRVYRSDIQAVSATYDMPMTLKVRLSAAWNGGQAVSAGGLITPSASNGYVYRADNAGTTGGGEPVWPTTLRSTVADNGITWRCYASDALGVSETIILNATTTTAWQPTYVPADLPPTPDSYVVQVMMIFGNTAIPTYDLAPINFSYRDGLSDADPAKQNYGQQCTVGDFFPPFLNAESTAARTVTLEAIIWSEIQQPKRVLARNTFSLPEVAGAPTAAAVVSGRLLVFKRRGFWVFKRTADRNIPILPERPANTEVGCIGPRAWDTYNDQLFWIGEHGVYRMGDDWQPVEIGGPQMRELIMRRDVAWVENQVTYNVPFLVVEHANKEVWVYTRQGVIFIYHIPTEAWTYLEVNTGSQHVRSMFYDFGGNRMVVAFGGLGGTRCDETASAAQDTLDNTATNVAITNDIVFKPLELAAPRYETAIEEVGLFHLATAAQAGQTVSAAYSLDRGATYTTPSGYPATASLASNRIPLPLATLGPTLTPRIRRVGNGGAAAWSISKADAKLQVKRGEIPWATAT